MISGIEMMEERVSAQQGKVASLWRMLIALAVIAILVVVAIAAFKAGQSLPGYWREDFVGEEKGNPENNPNYVILQSNMYMFYGDPIFEGSSWILLFTFDLGLLSVGLLVLSLWPAEGMWWMCLQMVIMLIVIGIQVGMYHLTLREITR